MGFDTYIDSIRKDMLAFLDTLNFNDILEKEPTLIVHWEQINYLFTGNRSIIKSMFILNIILMAQLIT